MLYDVFICHASEDKDSFVRPLAEMLREKHLEVWYDEFTLRLGDSIRRAIDVGLAQSTYGIVVLSQAFFDKNWPQYELDGLLGREMSAGKTMLLPIWHNVTFEDVSRYSPALAGKYAVNTARGLEAVAADILKVVKPDSSPLIVARDFLIEIGVEPPVVTDAWWLKAVEASNRAPPAGAAVPDESVWGRWAFPLPPLDTPAEWGERIAWAALQLDWTAHAEEQRITLLSHPDDVIDFIRNNPGLMEACESIPGLVAEYAPQITIPGFGGELEDVFERAYQSSRGEEEWSLRHAAKGFSVDSTDVASEYFQGGLFGPDVSDYHHAEHLAWLLSRDSAWLPAFLRELLIDGFSRRGRLWMWMRGNFRERNFAWATAGEAYRAFERSIKSGKYRWTTKVEDDWLNLFRHAVGYLGLPDTPAELLERVHSCKVVELAMEGEAELQAMRRR